MGRHVKSHNHRTIGRGNIFILRKNKDYYNTVETISLNSMNGHILLLMFQKGQTHLVISYNVESFRLFLNLECLVSRTLAEFT